MKRVRIAELKAHLSKHLRAVRRGTSITVLDRDTPIARIVPYVEAPALIVREPVGDLQSVKLPPPLGIPTDSLAALLEERGER